jgi:mRNA interferase MazF
MHRDFAGRHLRAVLAAPLTTTIRDIPTAVRLGPDQGLDRECVASLDNLTLVSRERFQHKLGELDPSTMSALCRALMVSVGCN